MMRCKLLIAGLLLAQVAIAQEAASPVVIKGKPILTVFSNYKMGLGNTNDISGFNLDRAFVGYEAFFDEGFSAKVVMNVETKTAEDGNTEFGTYLKNAQINWSKNNFAISLGLVNLKQFSFQENVWGHRYVYKSFQEEHKFSYCEDIGVVAEYVFSPLLSADVAITNGEGRKLKNADNNYRYGLGVSFYPIDHLTLRVYTDVYSKIKQENDYFTDLKDQHSLALFIGYSNNRLSLGAEFNKLYHSGFIKQNNLTGYSAYATLNTNSKFSLYGRFDLLQSKNNWNANKDGNNFIVGLDYKPIKYVRLSPNFQSWKGENQERQNYLLLSAEFKL